LTAIVTIKKIQTGPLRGAQNAKLPLALRAPPNLRWQENIEQCSRRESLDAGEKFADRIFLF
jgi:hypothetical protein